MVRGQKQVWFGGLAVVLALALVIALADGVTAEEFDRATIGIKSHLIMQGESTAARASAIAQDTFRLGRPRTLGELAETIDAISVDDLNAYLSRRDFGAFTVATIGPASIRAEALV